MELDLELRQIRRISAQTGLGLKFISKDISLSKLLKYLESVLDDSYVLKGGTAISRAGYLPAPRFSEDVDIDYFTRERWQDAGTKLYDMLKNLEGFTVKPPRYQRDSLRCDAYFDNHFGEKDRIRVEVSPKPKDSTKAIDAAKTLLQSKFTSGQASLIKTYSKVELIAMKIDALSNRLDGKDVFDLMGMLSSDTSKDEILRKLKVHAKRERKAEDAIISNAILNLEKMALDVKIIANSANHFIPRTERPEWRIMLGDLKTVLKKFQAFIY